MTRVKAEGAIPGGTALLLLFLLLAGLLGGLAGGCAKDAPPLVYQAVPVETRDIVVSAQAAGAIEPDTTVEVKSKASGEILEMRVETGQEVNLGDLMVRVDPRIPRNQVATAQADLEVAKARMANSEAQQHRAEELYRSQSITETEYEAALLDYANAKADVVRAQISLENARIELDDTDVRAPISGTIIEKDVERGQVISSPSRDVGGGTVLLRMADLGLVRVRTLVDETDIGKIHPGQAATITVDAYPSRPFAGEVLKIEPLAVTQQNVTMFPVLVRIDNHEGLLRPGMNCEVEIHVGARNGVLAVPNAALRTTKDVGSAAQVLGLDPQAVQKQLAEARPKSPAADTSAAAALADSARPGGAPGPAAGATMTTPDGRTIPLPPGVSEKDVRAAFQKLRAGEELSGAERALLAKLRGHGGPGRGGGGGASGGSGRAPGTTAADSYVFGGQYIVFVLRHGEPVPVSVRTGLTDLDYSEVLEGLAPGDSVLILPSASLAQSQQEFKQRVTRMMGSFGGMRQVQSSSGSGGGGGGR